MIEFHTIDPLQTVTRALDELARSGFRLAEMRVIAPQDTAQVRLIYDGVGSVSAQTYALRVFGIPGVQPVDLAVQP